MNSPTVTDVAKAQITALQQEWLDLPCTQLMVKAIKTRRSEYDKRLVDRCRTISDEKSDIQDRACISTCDALLKIIGDQDLFVQYSTKQPSVT